MKKQMPMPAVDTSILSLVVDWPKINRLREAGLRYVLVALLEHDDLTKVQTRDGRATDEYLALLQRHVAYHWSEFQHELQTDLRDEIVSTWSYERGLEVTLVPKL
jgi:hypothetical protein